MQYTFHNTNRSVASAILFITNGNNPANDAPVRCTEVSARRCVRDVIPCLTPEAML